MLARETSPRTGGSIFSSFRAPWPRWASVNNRTSVVKQSQTRCTQSLEKERLAGRNVTADAGCLSCETKSGLNKPDRRLDAAGLYNYIT